MSKNNEKDTLMQHLSEDASNAITDLLYEKVESLLESEDSLFTIKIPGGISKPNNNKEDVDDK